MAGPEGVQAVPEELQPKAYTPVRAEFRASCRLNGYDLTLCDAFVVPGREVWWIENPKTGERRFVFGEEKEELIDSVKEKAEAGKPADAAAEGSGTAPKEPAAAVPAGSAEPEWRLVKTYFDPVKGTEVETVQPIVPADQLLEMSPGEAQAYGFSKGIVADEAGLIKRYNLSGLVRLAPSWSEALAHWLTSVYVRGFLMVLILLGLYVEFHTPGVGLAGLVALICLGIFVGAPYLTGLANVWEIICLVVGFALILLEIFVVPGFGVAGISGIGLVVVGLLATFVPDEPGQTFPIYFPTMPESIGYLKAALATLVCSMAASLVGMVMLSRFLPRVPVLNRLIPANPTPSQVLIEDPYRGAARVGDRGVAEGMLRPAGKARFGNTLVDVVTQGELIEANATVEVIERRGNRVVVRAVRT
jgi:membrane-bound serine protease (ClpP class)